MSVDAATVRRIAQLARIAVTEDEVPHLQGELNAMLDFVEQLSEVNVEGVEHRGPFAGEAVRPAGCPGSGVAVVVCSTP